MDTSADLLAAFKEIESERGIDRESLFEAIETSLLTACKKNFGTSQNIRVHMDRQTGRFEVYAQKDIVEEVGDPLLEITLEEAHKINPVYNMGDVAEVVITPRNFGRISAQSAKQVVMQKIREAERNILYKEFKEKEREVVTGIVQRYDKRSMVVSLGKIEALMPMSEQVPGERYAFGDRVKVYVLDVKDSPKGPLVNVSRTHPELVKRLFENEVPEIFDGIVEIKSISREAGSRTKMAVYSKNPNVEAVGACVGQNGYRVNVVVRELRGEKIDIVNWSPEPRQFISAALNPSKTLAVVIDHETRSARIVVPDYQLSLAIGKEGQNVRLAAKLSGYKIDIRSEAQARATGFILSEEFFREGEPDSFTLPIPEDYLDDDLDMAAVEFVEAHEDALVAGDISDGIADDIMETVMEVVDAPQVSVIEVVNEHVADVVADPLVALEAEAKPAAAESAEYVEYDEYYDEYGVYMDENGELYYDGYYEVDENFDNVSDSVEKSGGGEQ